MENRIQNDLFAAKIGALMGTAIGFSFFIAQSNEVAVQALPAVTCFSAAALYLCEQLIYSPAQLLVIMKGWMTSKNKACTYSAKVTWERARKFGMRPFALAVADGCEESDLDTSHTYVVAHLGGVVPIVLNRPHGEPCEKANIFKIALGGIWDKKYEINEDVYNCPLTQLD